MKELLQTKLSEDIKKEVLKILGDKDYRDKMLEEYQKIKQISGDGTASRKTAEIIYNEIKH